MKKFIRSIYIKLFRPSVIIDSQLVSYEDADAMIKLDSGWELAKTDEELLEQNMVWIIKRYYITE